MPGYHKSPPTDLLWERYEEATRRADELMRWQCDRGCDQDNPSTLIHLLTEKIRELGRDRHIERVEAARQEAGGTKAKRPRER